MPNHEARCGCVGHEDDWENTYSHFRRKALDALEFAMEYQSLSSGERDRRRGDTHTWLSDLRDRDRFSSWRQTIREASTRFQDERDSQEAKAKREAAKERAIQLLRSALSPKQLQEFDRRGYFHVQVGDRRFRVTRKRTHNVLEVDGQSRILRSLCAHPVEFVPDEDTMLSQKLILESHPEEFFKLANVMKHRRRRPTPNPATRAEAGENLQIVHQLRQIMTPTHDEVQAVLDVTARVELPNPTDVEVPAQVPANEQAA